MEASLLSMASDPVLDVGMLFSVAKVEMLVHVAGYMLQAEKPSMMYAASTNPNATRWHTFYLRYAEQPMS